MKVYSGINNIKVKNANGPITCGCLALEGGAFRGVYTSGVLDCLMENEINLSVTVGVSAGALNGVNYTSSQIGRSALCNLKYRHDSRWVGIKALKTDSGIIGFDFLQKDFLKESSFNEQAFQNPKRQFIAAATNLESGKPEYFNSTDLSINEMFRSVAASASMPFVSKPVEIDGKKYLDGGCSAKLPIRWAFEQNFEKIVFVGTNIATWRRNEESALGKLGKIFYRKYPEFVRSLEMTNKRYNSDCDLMDSMTKNGRMFRISPSVPVEVSRLEGDMEKLGALYHLGYNDALNSLPALKEYLFS